MNINQGENRQEAKEAFEQNYTHAKTEIKKNMRFVGLLFVVILIGILLSNSFYIVKEDEVATVRELGEIKKIIVDATNVEAQKQNERDPRFKDVVVDTTKGLKFKIPFITTVEKDTSKIITYISNTAKINTQDKIKYEINMYAQWKIIHPGVFRTSLGTITRANSKIDEITYAVVIEKINSLMSLQFLANKETLESVLATAKDELNVNLASQGIMLVDIDIYRTILPPSNIESTYKKMVAEREAIAQQIRSEGLEIYQNTVADTDRNVAQIKANAIEESETIRGEADATALEVYASGFTKDPEFYEFWRTLKSYEETFDADTVLYLDKNNSYLNFFSNGQ
ncbi:MAG: protease modulator HflC [Bacillota bacterium]|nr:protease modulator HflC [Bacillota bacterium]